MREDIKTLKVCGGVFIPEAIFNFFGNETQANKKLLVAFYMAETVLVKVLLLELFA